MHSPEHRRMETMGKKKKTKEKSGLEIRITWELKQFSVLN